MGNRRFSFGSKKNRRKGLSGAGEKAGIIIQTENTINQGKNMKKKIRLSRKTQKIILGICIAAMVLLGVGLFLIHTNIRYRYSGQRDLHIRP